MIEIKNLNKIYKSSDGNIHALDNINLTIEKGEIFGIIGLSGAGKSTLIRCINRLEEPSSGEIHINGKEITSMNKSELKKTRKKIGMIFQHFNLLNSRTVFGNIAFPLEIEGLNKDKIKNRVEELLRLVNLSDKKNSYPSELSGGQKQRVAIARALANEPDVLLSDEGTSALDPKTTKSILKLLKKVQKELNLTIVLITHQMEVIKDICDRVAIIEGGKIIELGSVKEVFANPKTKTARTFISDIKKYDQEEINFPKIPGSRVYRLSYVGESSKKPIISQMIRNFEIDVNILSGNINELMSTSVGNLLIQITGEKVEIDKAIEWLNKQQVRMEVIWNG